MRILDRRTLNRSLLERQMLLRRRRGMRTLDAVEHLVALQAQEPRDPYVALWSRLDRFRPEELSSALADRRAVRMTLLRGTLHLVTARDALALRPLFQRLVESHFGRGEFRKAAEGLDLEDLKAMFAELMAEEPRTRSELVRAAAERWPARDANTLGYAMYLIPSVQVTPRGLWGRSGRAAFTTLEAWLGPPPPDAMTSVDEVVLRYLRAFGPATPADVANWSRLTGIREALERRRSEVRTFRDDSGRELFDVVDGPLPSPETAAPVRFLPQYDNVLLGHADRSRILPEEFPQWTELGWASVLVDGFMTARWRLDEEKDRATLRVETFRRLSREEKDEVEREGGRLAKFLAPEARTRRVMITADSGVYRPRPGPPPRDRDVG